MFVPFCLRKTGLISAVSEFFSVWRVGGRGAPARAAIRRETESRETRDRTDIRDISDLRLQSDITRRAQAPTRDRRDPISNIQRANLRLRRFPHSPDDATAHTRHTHTRRVSRPAVADKGVDMGVERREPHVSGCRGRISVSACVASVLADGDRCVLLCGRGSL